MYRDPYQYSRYAERIDYKAIIMDQIQFIHMGLQVGNTRMVTNGILSLQVLLSPMLDDKTKDRIEKLMAERGEAIAQLLKIEPMRRAYERKALGEPDYEQVIAQKRFELEQEKYMILLDFAQEKDLLIAEVETEDFL